MSYTDDTSLIDSHVSPIWIIQIGEHCLSRITVVLRRISILEERQVPDPLEVAVWWNGSFWEYNSLPSTPATSEDEMSDSDSSD
uniref:Non-structural protein 3b n=1 Tax=Bird deltacoronavirus AnasCN24 TaxID=3237947 RepID=A0AB39AGG8_9NIDO